MSQQAVIPASGALETDFDSFHIGENSLLVERLREMAAGNKPGTVLYLWGETGAGKSHLLNACCELARKTGRPFHYLVGSDKQRLQALLEGVADATLVCLDQPNNNSERKGFAGVNENIELGWLSLYEQLINNEGNLVIAGRQPPSESGFQTLDLVSRLSSGGVFYVHALDDAGKRMVLGQRARGRGFALSDAVVDYIMNRLTRDSTSLFALLDKIDRASLAQHRKITIPFVRDLIDS